MTKSRSHGRLETVTDLPRVSQPAEAGLELPVRLPMAGATVFPVGYRTNPRRRNGMAARPESEVNLCLSLISYVAINSSLHLPDLGLSSAR